MTHCRARRHWCVRGAKLFIDGTLDNGTAWLASPDEIVDAPVVLTVVDGAVTHEAVQVGVGA